MQENSSSWEIRDTKPYIFDVLVAGVRSLCAATFAISSFYAQGLLLFNQKYVLSLNAKFGFRVFSPPSSTELEKWPQQAMGYN